MTVVYRFVGETEINLNLLPPAGHTSTVTLLFDEADGVFEKQSGVKDTPDRYANLEITYLLQRPEEQPGAVILTSNLNKAIDRAFSPHIIRVAAVGA